MSSILQGLITGSLGLLLAMALIKIGVWVLWRVPWLHDPVYVPSQEKVVAQMVKIAQLKPGMKVADFGAGDGRVVEAFARVGCQVDGYEIHPWLVWHSRRRLRRHQFLYPVRIIHHSFWSVDTSHYDVVLLYSGQHLMARLEEKLKAELRPGTQIISNTFTFPTWPLQHRMGKVFLYTQTKLKVK